MSSSAGQASHPLNNLSLSSNNPFRNSSNDLNRGTIASPTIANLPISPTSPFDDPPPLARPVSRNPFLDPANQTNPSIRMPATKENEALKTEQLFNGLTLDDTKTKPNPVQGPGGLRPPPNMDRPGAPRGNSNVGPGGPSRRGAPPLHHRPSRSQEESMKGRRPRPAGGPDGPTSPPRRSGPSGPSGSRVRRNSESSVMEEKLTPDERKARDQRRRERERRHRDGKDKPAQPSKRMDIIDRLDATGIFGTGMFHHDGPFDAANAHRNSSGVRRKPMEAFPKDSVNMTIGGSGPVNKRANHDTFMGNGTTEAFTDYAAGGCDRGEFGQLRPKGEIPTWDPLSRGSVVHGEQTIGLGTSTFLEGTPAAPAALREQENQDVGGIQRKKSLAQRIRGVNRAPRNDYSSGRVMSPGGGPYRDVATAGPSVGRGANEANPFFTEYDNKKGGEQITVRKMSNSGAISPPLPGLERRATTDSYGDSEPQPQQQHKAGKSGGGGLLSRVKSLKGGNSKARPADPPQPPPSGMI